MSMEPIAADLELFSDALTCEERLQMRFLLDDVDDPSPDEMADAAESLLRAVGQAEESGLDDGEERGSSDPAIARLEGKLNLLLRIVGGLARNHQMPSVSARWSRRGLSFPHSDGELAEGTRGHVRISLGVLCPLPLELPVRVLCSAPDSSGSRLRVKIDPCRPALEAAIERHLFRLHRRALARRAR